MRQRQHPARPPREPRDAAPGVVSAVKIREDVELRASIIPNGEDEPPFIALRLFTRPTDAGAWIASRQGFVLPSKHIGDLEGAVRALRAALKSVPR